MKRQRFLMVGQPLAINPNFSCRVKATRYSDVLLLLLSSMLSQPLLTSRDIVAHDVTGYATRMPVTQTHYGQ